MDTSSAVQLDSSITDNACAFTAPFDKLPKDKIAEELIKVLRVGKDYTKAEVKELLQNIYSKLDIPGNPSASDISDYLTCEDRTNRMEGKKVAVFRIASHIRKKISLFGRITDINHPEEYDIDKVLDIIKTDSYYHVAGKVDAVRKAKTKEEKEKAKMKLPAVTWNGTFKTKNRSDLIHYSSFTALDFDHIQPEKMDEFGKWLQGFSCVYAYYVTPSGKGYKAVILHDNYEPLYHYDLYNQLLELFDCPEKDTSTVDLARGNFLSYDPNLWKNPKPEPFHFVPSTSEPIIPETVTETIIKDETGTEIMKPPRDLVDVDANLLQFSGLRPDVGGVDVDNITIYQHLPGVGRKIPCVQQSHLLPDKFLFLRRHGNTQNNFSGSVRHSFTSFLGGLGYSPASISAGSGHTPYACYVTFPHYYDTTTSPFCPQNTKK